MATLNELQLALENIRADKNANLKPKNLRKGVTCLGIVGTGEIGEDTSGATAESSDLIEGKTAWAREQELTGTLEELQAPLQQNWEASDVVYDDSDASNKHLDILAEAESDIAIREGAGIWAQASASDVANAIGLEAEKIIEGNEILGVIGTGKTGAVKMFDSVEEMQEDEDAEDGDLAIVYKIDTETDLNGDLKFSGVELKESFELPAPISSSYYYYWSAVDSSSNNGSLNLNVGTSSAQVSISGNGNERIYINYTSSDAQHYTFSNWQEGDYYSGQKTYDTMQKDKYIWGYALQKNGSWYTWNDNLKYMVQPIIYTFNGLYSYRIGWKDMKSLKTFTNLRLEDNAGTITAQKDNVSYVDLKRIADFVYKIRPDIFPENHYGSSNIWGFMVIKDKNEKGEPTRVEFHKDKNTMRKFDGTTYFYNGYSSTAPSTTQTYTKYTINLSNETITETTVSSIVKTMVMGSSTYYATVYQIDFDISNAEMAGYCCLYSPTSNTSSSWGSSFSLCNDYISGTTTTTNYYNINYENQIFDKYLNAATQLTLAKPNQIFDDLSAYGGNGMVQGDGSYLRNITGQNFINTWLPNFNPNAISTSDLYDTILNSGTSASYQTFVSRTEVAYDDITDIPTTVCLVRKDDKTETTITIKSSDILYKAYNAQQHRNMFYRKNGDIYWVYMGFNFNSTSSGDRKTLNNIYGVVYNLNTGELYKSIENNSAWRPFSAWSSQDCCSILSAGYIDSVDKWIITLDTDSWGFTNGPYYGMIRINGTTGARQNNAVRLNQLHSASYHRTNVDTYSPDEDAFYVTGYDDDVYGVQKVNNSGGVSTVFSSGTYISSVSTFFRSDSDYAFGLSQPIVYYYTNNNYYLRNLRTGKIYQNNNLYSVGFNTCWLEGDYFYFSETSTNASTGKTEYNLCKMNYSTFENKTIVATYDKSFSVLWYNGERTLYFSGDGNKIRSIQTGEVLAQFNPSGYYNYQPVDGVYYDPEDGLLKNEAPIKNLKSNTQLVLTDKSPRFFRYDIPDSFPVAGDIFYLGYADSGTKASSSSYLYNAKPLSLQPMTNIELAVANQLADTISGEDDE